MATVTEQVVCQCGAVCGRYAIEWRTCPGCGRTLCPSRCFLGHWDECWQCQEIKYEARREEREKTLVECVSCHQMKLPEDMEYPETFIHEHEVCCSDSLKKCKSCTKMEKEAKVQSRKQNSRPGLVEVEYGEYPPATEDGGKGYAYHSDEPLRLGDVVQVPQTWLGKLRDDSCGPQLATVVSTYSDYDGPVSGIIRVVKNGNRRRAASKSRDKVPEEKVASGRRRMRRVEICCVWR